MLSNSIKMIPSHFRLGELVEDEQVIVWVDMSLQTTIRTFAKSSHDQY